MKKRIVGAVFITLGMLVTGCTNGGVINKTVSVTGVSIDVHSVTMDIGDTQQFQAFIEPENATDKKVTWSILDTSIAEFRTPGVLTALSSGDTTVIVSTHDGGFTDTCSIHVNEVTQVTLTSITVDASEAKTDFYLNELFTYNNLIVTAYYSNGTNERIYNYNISYPDMTTPGDKQVEVSFTYQGVTRNDFYTIHVTEPAPVDRITSIELSGSYQTEFIQNDEFIYDGLVVTAHHSVEPDEILDASQYTISTPNMSQLGDQEVRVTLNSDTSIYSFYIIQISEPVIQDEITGLILSGIYQTDFNQNDDFNYDGLIVTAEHSIEPNSVLNEEEYTVSTPDMSILGEQEVIVSLNSNPSITESYYINIYEPQTVYDSMLSLIAGLPYNSGDTDEFHIKGTVTCGYVNSNGTYDFYIQNKSENSAFYVFRHSTCPEVGSLVEISGYKNNETLYRYNGGPQIYGDAYNANYPITVTELLDADHNTESITPYISSGTEWYNSLSISSDIYQFAYAHGPLQYKLKDVTITPNASDNRKSTVAFENGTTVSLYYGGIPNQQDIHAQANTLSGQKVDVVGYLNSFAYNSSGNTQLLVRYASDIVKSENQGGGEEEGEDKAFNVVALNDFHGAIMEDGEKMGLAKVGSFLKEASDSENTLVLDQGDDWQGSIYSNYNRGELINDVFAYAHITARTIGNHDFDWGVDNLIELSARPYNGYVTPVLAANVYNYDYEHGVALNTPCEDIGVPSIVKTLDNGLKVGIVGIIGQDQFTSIVSLNTQDIYFKEHLPIMMQEAARLRNEESCDIVIASAHAGQSDSKGNDYLLNKGLSTYFDLILCAHTHKYENAVESGTYFLQFGSSGKKIGVVSMNYNTGTKAKSTNYGYIASSNIDENLENGVDSNIQNIINTYCAQCIANENPNETVAKNVVGTFYSNNQASNMMCKAIYDQCVYEGYTDIDLAYCNNARENLNSGSWSYADIYEAFPFDNLIHIEEVPGSEILSEVKPYNYVYFRDGFNFVIDPNATYKIAVLDYLLYHVNVNKVYDYFDTFDGNSIATLSVNYRLILKQWLAREGYTDGTKTLYASDFSKDLTNYDRTRLSSL